MGTAKGRRCTMQHRPSALRAGVGGEVALADPGIFFWLVNFFWSRRVSVTGFLVKVLNHFSGGAPIGSRSASNGVAFRHQNIVGFQSRYQRVGQVKGLAVQTAHSSAIASGQRMMLRQQRSDPGAEVACGWSESGLFGGDERLPFLPAAARRPTHLMHGHRSPSSSRNACPHRHTGGGLDPRRVTMRAPPTCGPASTAGTRRIAGFRGGRVGVSARRAPGARNISMGEPPIEFD